MTDQDLYTRCKRAIAFVYEAPAVKGDEFPCIGQHPIATGFMFAIALKDRDVFYLLTNKHVLFEEKATQDVLILRTQMRGLRDTICVRLNDPEDKKFVYQSIDLETEGLKKNVWQPNLESVDLVAIHIPLEGELNFAPASFTMDNLHNGSTLSFGVGTAACAIGYLSGYAGIEKNHPIVRFGRIAMTSSEQWLSTERNFAIREQAYLAEFSAVGGASGSPVVLDFPERPDHPIIIGVVKSSMTSLNNELQGLVAIEPPMNLADFVQQLKGELSGRGMEVL
ncbi:MAG: hypothetical protein P4L53_26795 [Candidatus Obscuribacterales bacterium]|nr:hypothetical protein [Candidatus Obscuribacterales bacterium]